jgi:hypothetical protein
MGEYAVYAAPRAPAGLLLRGRRLWRSLVGAFQFRDDELTVLEQACRLLDEITTLEGALSAASAVVAGSRGQLRTHPLYGEVRAHRLALGRLLGQLGLAGADAADAGSRKSHQGRSLARLRWG